MSLLPNLLRRRGPSSENMRRRSVYSEEAANNADKTLDGRASEQIPRKPDVADLLSPSTMAEGASSRASVEGATLDRSISPPVQEESNKHRRFSMLKFRHASDSQLSRRARDQARPPPIPPTPEIITTAPTLDINATPPAKKKTRMLMPRMKTSTADDTLHVTKNEKRERRKTMSESGPSGSKSRVTFDEPERPVAPATFPPAYGDDNNSSLALPINRLSESSRSDGSSGDHGVYASTTTTTHTVHTTTTFFRLPRRRKPAPLFDLSHLPQKTNPPDQAGPMPRISASSSTAHLGDGSIAGANLRSPSTDNVSSGQRSPVFAHSSSALVKTSSTFAAPAAPLLRQGSTASSAKSSPTRTRLGLRGRSSTLSSLRNTPTEDALPTPTLPPSGRTSISTGRKSFGDLFNLSHRLRQNSEPTFPRGSGPVTPGSSTSKNNSIQLPREPPIIIPERNEDDTPAKYLIRLEEAVSRGVVASVLSKGTDQFSQAVLRSYMRGFAFFGDPMDMAIRKLLMEVELPKETQQIDRCLQGFADRYHECNPGIYASPDQAYFIAFSLLILHTDVFNKNNKHKMQKPDYLRNTKGEGIFDEILECFYDNISYTPFIHVEDDLDINGERILPHKMKKKSILSRGTPDPMKRPSKEPVDPYTLILDSKLDTLRPNLKEVMYLDEHYSYLGTAPSLNLQDLQKTFFRTGVLQIVSARSRPDAFMSEKTVTNPEEAHPGIVDIKITKVGLLWRKDPKKKKTRSPWQEWGAILTGAQLYFFRNTNWIKGLMSQLETHNRQGHDGSPVVFKPPLDQFKPDALMSTDDAVALLDSTYKKHKNAFVFVRHGGFEETFLADNEQEMNDWLAKLNYAAAFRTSGVRMRGVVGGNYDGQRTRGIRRLESSSESSKSVQTPTGEVTIVSGRIDRKMADDILAARREIMLQKITDAEEKLAVAQKQLDAQLRNARHLQILAPIQAKTREQVVLAAGRMAAQLKWGRMEIWRLKCHKDILVMDLEEEKKTERVASPVEAPTSDKTTLGRLQSKASTIKESLRSPILSSPRRPSTATQHTQHIDQGVEDVFQTPPTLGHASSFHKAQATWELPPLVDNTSPQSQSSPSAAVPSSPISDHHTSSSSLRANDIETERAPSPNVDAAEQLVLAQEGLVVDVDKTPEGKRIASRFEAGEAGDHIATKEKDGLNQGNKIRRSLHRTLREAHVPNHTRSRKGKDSSSSTAMSDESKDDMLARGTGSFVVHGKKASVITFGSELHSMSPDERLRLRRQSQKDDAGGMPPTMEDFRSVLAEPVEYHERHGSAATASTATARSFRELHSRLALSGGALASEGEDSDGATFSDGRRTPLPPVDDEEEEAIGSHAKQASFYTPEPSPTVGEFNEKLKDLADGDDDETRLAEAAENQPLPSTPLQTMISA